MAGRQVSVEIVGDSKLDSATNDAIASLDRLADASKAFGDKMVGLGKTWSLNVTLPIAALAAVGFKELEESGKVAAQTEAAIRSTGGAANVTARQVDDLAMSLLRKTGIDDEAIKSGENLLLTFTQIRNEAGKGNDIFTQATKLSLDLSVAWGEDMHAAAIQLGKALNDPIQGVTALRRVGVQLTDAQKDQISTFVEAGDVMSAQKVILGELRKEVGGSAQAYGETMAGQVSRAREELKNASAAMLVVAAPAIETVARAAMGLAGWMENLDGTTKKVVVTVAALAAAAGPTLIIIGKMAQGFSALIHAGIAIADRFESIAIAALYAKDAMVSFLTSPQFLAVTAITAGIIALSVALRDDSNAWSQAAAAGKQAGQDLVDAAKSSADELESLKIKMTGVNAEAMGLAASHHLTFEEIVKLNAEQETLGTELDKVKQAHHDAAVAAAAHEAALQNVATATDTVTTATDDAWNSIQQLQGLLLGSQNAELSYQQSLLSVQKATDDLNIAIRDHGANSDEAKEATLRLQQAQLQAAQSALTLDDAHTNLTRGVAGSTEGVNALIAKLEEDKAKHPEQAAAIDGLIWKLGELRGATEAQPTDHTTTMHVETAAAMEALRNFSDAINNAIHDAGASVVGGWTAPPHGAEGAIVSRPTIALIGEAGPEAVVPLNRMPGAFPLPRGGSPVAGTAPTVIQLVVDGRVLAEVAASHFNRAGGPQLSPRAIAS